MVMSGMWTHVSGQMVRAIVRWFTFDMGVGTGIACFVVYSFRRETECVSRRGRSSIPKNVSAGKIRQLGPFPPRETLRVMLERTGPSRISVNSSGLSLRQS